MAARKKTVRKTKKIARKAGKRLVKELGGKKKVNRAAKKAAGQIADKGPRKAGAKLIKGLGGKGKVKRAVKRALAGAAALAAGLRGKALGGADA